MNHKLVILACAIFTCTHGIADTKTVPTEGKDPRQGITAERFLKGEMQAVTIEPQQTGGDTPLFSTLFKPTLAEWQKSGQKTKLTPTPFVREGNTPTPEVKIPVVEEVSDLSRFQYFFNESLHAELKGKRAKEILDFTHSENGKVFVSTTIERIYPEKKYVDDDTGKEERAQCIDVLTRITVTRVPMVNKYGLNRLVDFWQDFKNFQCRSNSNED